MELGASSALHAVGRPDPPVGLEVPGHGRVPVARQEHGRARPLRIARDTGSGRARSHPRPGLPSAPPGQKSFWRSTTTSASRVGSIVILSPPSRCPPGTPPQARARSPRALPGPPPCARAARSAPLAAAPPMRPSAQAAWPRTVGSACPSASRSAATSPAVPPLPSAIAALRASPSRRARLSGLPRKALEVGRLAESQQLGERRMPARPERRLARDGSAAVPRADVLAHVAAEGPAADAGPEVGRDRSPALDRQVRDAAPRVQHVRVDEGPRGAGVQAARAAPAAVRQGRIGLELRRGQHHADEEEGARGPGGAASCSSRSSPGRPVRRDPARGADRCPRRLAPPSPARARRACRPAPGAGAP